MVLLNNIPTHEKKREFPPSKEDRPRVIELHSTGAGGCASNWTKNFTLFI
jgi:hypothetical protein